MIFNTGTIIKPNLRKKIMLCINKPFENKYEALESLGYRKLEESYQYGEDSYEIFEKNGKEYIYREMDCSNNYIYNVFITPIEESIQNK